MCSGSEAGSYVRLIDFVLCTSLNSRLESNKEEGTGPKASSKSMRTLSSSMRDEGSGGMGRR